MLNVKYDILSLSSNNRRVFRVKFSQFEYLRMRRLLGAAFISLSFPKCGVYWRAAFIIGWCLKEEIRYLYLHQQVPPKGNAFDA